MRSAIAALCLLVAACGRSAPADPPPPVADAVRHVSGSTSERVQGLNMAARRHRGDPASLLTLARDPDVRVRFGAAYVAALWADDPADAAALSPLLSDADEAVRAVVAGSLAGLGHAEARRVLEGLRSSTTAMPFSDPPITVGRFATDGLAGIDAAGARR